MACLDNINFRSQKWSPMNVTATYSVHRQQETKLQWQIEHPRFLSLCSTGLLHSVLSEDYISVYGTSMEV